MTPRRPTVKGYYWMQSCDDNGRWMRPEMVEIVIGLNHTLVVWPNYREDIRKYNEQYTLWSEPILPTEFNEVLSVREEHVPEACCSKCFTFAPRNYSRYAETLGRWTYGLPTNWRLTIKMILCQECSAKYKGTFIQ